MNNPDYTVLIAAIGLGILAKNWKWMLGSILLKTDKIADNIKEKRALQADLYRSRPDVRKKREEIMKALESEYVTEEFRFWSPKRDNSKKFKFSRVGKFDEEKDVLIHGRLLTKDKDGKVHGEDIFLFQPRIYSRNNVVLGPRLTSNGSISDKATYACNDPELGILIGYAAKREVVSGIPMDYDIESEHPLIERFQGYKKMDRKAQREIEVSQEFLQVSLDRDKNGNVIPFDLSKPENRRLFDSYIEAHSTINSYDYYIDKRRKASRLAAAKIKEINERMKQIAIDMEYEEKKAAEETAPKAQKVTEAEKARLAQQKMMMDYYKYGIRPSYASNLPDMPPISSRNYDTPEDRMVDPHHMHHHH